MDILLNFADKYGIWGIFILILFIGIFLLFKYINNNFLNVSSGLEKIGENLTHQLSNQNEQLMTTIVNQQNKLVDHLMNKEQNDNENHNNMLNERINLSEDINESLKDIMHIHNSQRAFIIEFHNSYKNLSGTPFAKYSCTYEWFDKGLTPLSTKCTGLAFSMMSRVVSDILNSKTGQCIYTDLEKMEEENPVLFSIVKDSRTKAIVYTAMYDRNNVLIGLLVLEYQIPIEEGHLNLEQLKMQTAELTSILNIRYKYNSI